MPLLVVLIAVLLSPSALAVAPQSLPLQRSYYVSDALEVNVSVYEAEGDVVLLWSAPSFGLRAGQQRMARLMAEQGIEVWQFDLADALFLPRGSGTMRQIEGKYVADLIEYAHAETGKQVLLTSSSYGAIPLLRGARAWQLRSPARPYLLGAMLFSPNLYSTIPPLGLEPEYEPIVDATNVPVYILQGSDNANRWQLPRLVSRLEAGGSRVFVSMMPDVVGLFFDQTLPEHVEAQFQGVPGLVRRALPVLSSPPAPTTAVTAQLPDVSRSKGLDAELRPYGGDPNPPSIVLRDVFGKPHVLGDYRGQVTVVNFWATWCPPCVEEIPSLNRLRQAMADVPFELVSVNYAEDPATVLEFMDRVHVDFPVLSDPDGVESARWKVIVFPSTFVVGPNGQIRYGVNAAIEWDRPEVIAALRRLAAEGHATAAP
jgi:thiol-disulfide isomerase/thioredoxin